MVRQCKEHGLPEPEFVSVRNLEFKTILARDVLTKANLSQIGLNGRQKMAIKLIKEKGAISLSDIQDLYETTTRKTLYRDLQNLVDKKLIHAKGDRRGRKYTL